MTAMNTAIALMNTMAILSPNTGDTRNPVIFIVVGVIAAVLIALTVVLNNVSKKNKK